MNESQTKKECCVRQTYGEIVPHFKCTCCFTRFDLLSGEILTYPETSAANWKLCPMCGAKNVWLEEIK